LACFPYLGSCSYPRGIKYSSCLSYKHAKTIPRSTQLDPAPPRLECNHEKAKPTCTSTGIMAKISASRPLSKARFRNKHDRHVQNVLLQYGTRTPLTAAADRWNQAKGKEPLGVGARHRACSWLSSATGRNGRDGWRTGS
jgi:hypothetical protein